MTYSHPNPLQPPPLPLPYGVPVRSAHAPDRNWDLLLLALAVYLLTAVGRLHQLFPALAPLKPTLMAGGLAIVLWLWGGTTPQRRLRTALRLRVTRWLLGLLLWAVLSVPGALWVGGAFQLLTDILIKTVIMSVIVIAAARGLRDIERLAFVYFVGVAIYAAVVLTQFNVGTGASDWRLGGLFYYDANDFATLAVTTLPLALYFAVTRRRLVVRLAAAGGLAVIGTSFVWAGSRGGFLALLAVVLFVLLRFTAVRARWRVLATAGVVLLLMATASDTYWEKMGSLLKPSEDYNMTSREGRLQIWERGLGYMLRHPILGVGAANFSTAEGRISPHARQQERGRGVKWQAAHNSFVQIGAELGIPGLILFVGMIGSAFVALAAVRRRPDAGRAPPQLAQALTAALLGFAVAAFFLSLAYAEMLYTLVALAAGLHKVVVAAPPKRPAWLWQPLPAGDQR